MRILDQEPTIHRMACTHLRTDLLPSVQRRYLAASEQATGSTSDPCTKEAGIQKSLKERIACIHLGDGSLAVPRCALRHLREARVECHGSASAILDVARRHRSSTLHGLLTFGLKNPIVAFCLEFEIVVRRRKFRSLGQTRGRATFMLTLQRI